MLKPELLTALHYCAVITLTGAITSEYFLFRRGMSIEQVRKLLLADSLAALALLLIFITGVLLVVAHPQPAVPPLAPILAPGTGSPCLHPAAVLGDLDP